MEQSWAGIAFQAIPRQKWDILGGKRPLCDGTVTNPFGALPQNQHRQGQDGDFGSMGNSLL